MAQITPEIMDAFRAGRIFPLATASRKGEPNVAPIGAVTCGTRKRSGSATRS
ncbi:MAG: pyridoxamine 5'-phosphate oxidase family protein [Methanoregula sp.]|nr:pyridoxamine 5'-phosphate oxidase family protein [Methanoregula sp.]